MWVLAPGNSRELLERLRPHSVSPDFEVVWCGEGWRTLVSDCHDELVTAFPDYRFYAIKQKWGVLAFQARPRNGDATKQEQFQVDEITDRYRQASESVCEWCGRPGSLREAVAMPGRPEDLTLCDRCLAELETSPYPSSRPIR
jgi:hypothetical protein